MENVTVNEAFAMIAGVGAVVGVVVGWLSPVWKWRRRLERVEQSARLSLAGYKALGSCMIALLDHAITGNGADRLRAARDDLQRTLFDLAKIINDRGGQ